MPWPIRGRPDPPLEGARSRRYSTHDETAAPRARPTIPRRGGPSSISRSESGSGPNADRADLGDGPVDDGEPVEREHEEGAEQPGQRDADDGDARHELGSVEGVEPVLEQPRPRGAEQPERERGDHVPDEPGVGGVELASLEEHADDDVAGEEVQRDGEARRRT